MFGEDAINAMAEARRSTIEQWCINNAADWRISPTGNMVAFRIEDEAILFYLAHA
jgi:hypothetical protein